MFEKNENVQYLIDKLSKLYEDENEDEDEDEDEDETIELDSLELWFIENNKAVKLLLEDYSKIVSDNLNFVFSSNELSDVYKNQFRYDFIKYQSLVTTILNLEKALYYMKNNSFFMELIHLPYKEEEIDELKKMIKENESLNFTYTSFARECSYMDQDMDMPQFVVKCSFPIYIVFKFHYSDLEGIVEFSRKYNYLYNILGEGNTFDNWI